MFDATKYNDVLKFIGGANAIFAGALVLVIYFFVLNAEHSKLVNDTLSTLKLNPLVSGLVGLGVLAAIWSYVSTSLLQLHDRLYEPVLVKWRAAYDTDFILRRLCFGYHKIISPQIFSRAFSNKSDRHAFMQRLFYKFVGDTKKNHEELLSFMYTILRNYWVMVLAELYCIGLLILSTIYLWFFTPQGDPFLFLFVVVIVSLLLRIRANFYKDKIRDITEQQIVAILNDEKQKFEAELKQVAIDYDLRGTII